MNATRSRSIQSPSASDAPPSYRLAAAAYAAARALLAAGCASALVWVAAGCASALVWLAAGCASAPSAAPTLELTPERLYPMALGSAWSYDVDTGDGSAPVLAIARVVEASEGRTTMQGGEGTTHYLARADGIFRQEQDGYLLKAPIRAGAQWASGHGMQAIVKSLGVTIETAAGRFSGCVEVVEQGAASGAVITTTYCPDVGPTQVVSSMQLQLSPQAVRIVARLRGYRIGPESPAAPPTSHAASNP